MDARPITLPELWAFLAKTPRVSAERYSELVRDTARRRLYGVFHPGQSMPFVIGGVARLPGETIGIAHFALADETAGTSGHTIAAIRAWRRVVELQADEFPCVMAFLHHSRVDAPRIARLCGFRSTHHSVHGYEGWIYGRHCRHGDGQIGAAPGPDGAPGAGRSEGSDRETRGED